MRLTQYWQTNRDKHIFNYLKENKTEYVGWQAISDQMKPQNQMLAPVLFTYMAGKDSVELPGLKIVFKVT